MEFLDWGLIDYNKAWRKQEELFADSITRKTQSLPTKNYLIFCEHPNVYTLGKSGKTQNMLLDNIQLHAKNATFVHTNRGGDITYHGPGQVIGYPIIDLEHYKIGLKNYIYIIEESIIQLLNLYNITGERMQSATGVWLEAEKQSARKICAIGVRCSRFITMHGFALNVNTNLDYFNHINPCGFINKGVTSIEKEAGYKINIQELKQNLRIIIENNFDK